MVSDIIKGLYLSRLQIYNRLLKQCTNCDNYIQLDNNVRLGCYSAEQESYYHLFEKKDDTVIATIV